MYIREIKFTFVPQSIYNLLTLCHLLRYKKNNANIMKSSTRYESYTDGDDFINTSSDEFILILQ